MDEEKECCDDCTCTEEGTCEKGDNCCKKRKEKGDEKE